MGRLSTAALLVTALAGCAWGVACSRAGSGRSVLLITIDTLRADALSRAGNPRATSPALDAFTQRGAYFDRAFSPISYTVPAHASLLVGLYPSFHSAGLLNGQQPFLESEQTLAELLRDAGWRTGAVVSNKVLNRRVGLAQGFEIYDDELPDREATRGFPERRAPAAVDRALRAIGAFGDAPFFLWLHLQDPHGPYTPPVETPELAFGDADGAASDRVLDLGDDHSGFGAIPLYQAHAGERRLGQYRRRYEGEVRFVDSQLARLFGELDRRALLERALVVIAADHGEAMGEDGFFFSHSHSVGLDQVRVPLAFVGAGVRPGVAIAEPVTTLSVFATILDYLELPIPDEGQSHSLLPTLLRGEPVPSDPFFTESFGQRGVVFRDHYLRADRRPAEDVEFWRRNPMTAGTFTPLGRELVRLDGGGPSAPGIASELEALLADFDTRAERRLAELGAGAELARPDPDRIEELRALGYWQ